MPAGLAAAAILAGLLALPFLRGGDPGVSVEIQPAATPTLQLATATPTSLPAPPPEATASVVLDDAARLPERCNTVASRLSQLRASVSDAMEEYDGTWGFAVHDVDCDSLVTYPLGYAQYPASAGKIVIAIAALRAVEDGLLPFEDIEGHLELAVQLSLDAEIDVINDLLEPEQIAAVLELAGTSTLTEFEQEWRDARMSPADLARVWATLLRGDLLTGTWTDYLLRLASGAVFPEGYDTFPEDLDLPDYEYGQKAGYWVSLEEPDVLVGSGFIRPADGSSHGFALVLMVTTPMDDVFDEQRRSVFPLLLDLVLGELSSP